nr:hypothetical protein [Burkholderia sp. Bp8963]
MSDDLAARRPTEIEWINGGVSAAPRECDACAVRARVGVARRACAPRKG